MAFDEDALVEQYAQQVAAAAVAPIQAQANDLQAELASTQQLLAEARDDITSLKAIIADLQAQLAADQAHVIYGSNTGGWFSTAGENIATAKDRIKAGFGGQLPAIRVWTTNGVPSAAYTDPTCQVYLCELGAGMTDAQLDTAFKAALPGSVLVPAHEPETKLTPADFQKYAAQVGAAHVRSKRTDVKVALILMGTTFDTSRYSVDHGGPNTVGYFWDKWIPNPLPAGVDAIGGDLYPWGATDAKADSAATVVNPALAAAQKMGVPFYIGEFGCGSPKWSDAARAKYTSDCFAIFDANPKTFPVVCVYEADNGGGGPWCILPKPGSTTPSLPLTVAVVKNRISAVPKE